MFDEMMMRHYALAQMLCIRMQGDSTLCVRLQFGAAYPLCEPVRSLF